MAERKTALAGGPGQNKKFEKPKNVRATLSRLLKYMLAYK